MNYKPQPNKKSMPSRLARKKARNDSFIYNRTLRAKVNRERRAARVTE